MSDPENATTVTISCQQVLQRDGSVFSVQWLDFSGQYAKQLTAPRLLDRYLQYLRRITLALVRPTLAANGVQFRVGGTSWAILSFGPPQLVTGEGWEEVRLEITGGFMLHQGGCRWGVFSIFSDKGEDTVRARVQLSEFCPILLGRAPESRLRKQIYKWTQAWVHKLVTVHFLASVYRELTGIKAGVRVEEVRVREGTPI